MSDDLEPSRFPAVAWSSGELGASLDAIYRWVDDEAARAAQWYLDEKRPKARWSRWLRGVAIAFATAGAAIPFVAALASDVELEWGYLSLAIAAGVVGFDRFFGFSTAWMRYLTAEQSIEAARVRFQFKWAAELAAHGDRPLTPDDAVRLLGVLAEASERISGEVRAETNAWISEFQNNMAELRQLAAAPTQDPAIAAAADAAPGTPEDLPERS